MKYKKIALVKGGMGSERDVSLSTGAAFEQSLKDLNLEYVVIDAKEDFPRLLMESGADVALLALHGKYAEDGVVQGICEYLKIPYSGSGVLTSALCMNKVLTKQIFLQNGVSTPEYQLVDLSMTSVDKVDIFLQAPVVVKPSRDGSSVGITICKTNAEIRPAIEEASKFDDQILIERFISGIELTVPVIMGKSLTPIEILPKLEFYNYENKYTAGNTDYFLPARVEKEALEDLKQLSEKIYTIFNIGTYCRIDYMMDRNSKLYVLEINTLPGFTPTSLVPKSAKHDGIQFNDLILTLIEGAHLDYQGVK